jgi:hypothetical protein
MAKPPARRDADAAEQASSRTVGIRLDPEEYAMLTELGALKKRSPGSQAKEWILERLANPEVPEGWEDEVRKLQQALHWIRRDLALGFEVAVASTGAATPAEARDWADKNFRGKQRAVDQQSH